MRRLPGNQKFRDLVAESISHIFAANVGDALKSQVDVDWVPATVIDDGIKKKKRLGTVERQIYLDCRSFEMLLMTRRIRSLVLSTSTDMNR